MRLIDADKLILTLNDFALLNAPMYQDDLAELKPVYDAIQDCIKYVEEQPTVYEVIKGKRG
ncbi:MAG: hypothetical protein NC548_31220 [Lachnospiraceae bacterium]|nr:hypothetical protein [Bacteroides fragilis]MCM1218975.1 hypothetical protein [Lachnospiraceae bacterium]